MANTQPTDDSPQIEKVRYNPNATSSSHDNKGSTAYVLARCSPNSASFNVLFDTDNTATTTTSTGFLKAHYPQAEITRYAAPRRGYIGYADITIYIPGLLEIPHGLRAMGNATFRREEWMFQFDLKALVYEGSDGGRRYGVRVGNAVMARFDLALRMREDELVLRPDGLGTRGRIPLVHYP